MSNSTSANRSVRTCGTLAAILVVAAVGVSTALALQLHRSSMIQMSQRKQYERKLSDKQRQINTLKKQVSLLQQKIKQLSSRSGNSLLKRKQPVHTVTVQVNPWRRVKLTWYSSLQGTGSGYITATGTHVQDNWTVAVDPNVIPLGSIIEIRFADGTVRTYKAEDTGGAVRGEHIDIFESDNNQCIQNGVQWAEYRIVNIPSR
jgi:3D (Asp-Asp-Asp) domain-containing protein